jgi:hypothetical protein
VLPALEVPSALSLDPIAPPVDSVSLDARAALWLHCTEVGWFRTASGDGVRALSQNASYYADLCATLFGVREPRVAFFNAEFGGRSPTTASVVFSGGADDTYAAVAADETIAGRVNESFFVDLGSARDADALRDTGLAEAREKQIFEPINAWVNFTCTMCNRTYGECFLHTCICAPGWGTITKGQDECGGQQVPYLDLFIVEVLATILPTVLVLTIGFVTWCVLIQSKGGGSPGGSETHGRRWSGTLKPTVQI